ncbi:FtsB family cell division protein, partial [Angustibacter aerolatus]
GTRPGAAASGARVRAAVGPRPTRLRRIAVLGGVFVVLAVLLAPALRSYLAQQHDIAELREQVAAQRADVAQLERQRAAWDDDAYVKAQARERLKFVLPGEKAYTVIDAEPADTTPQASVRAAVRTARDDRSWFGNLWSSVQVAGAGAPR